MKSSKKTMMIIASCMVVMGVILTVFALSSGAKLAITNTMDGFKVVGPENMVTEEFSLSSFTSLKVDLNDVDVEMIPSTEYKLEIERLEETEIIHKVENDRLIIESHEQKSSPKFLLNLTFTVIPQTVVKIYVPKEAKFSDISLISKFGDILIDGMVVDHLVIYSDDGDITINDIQSNKLTIENGFGDINGDDIKTENLQIEMNDGDALFDSIAATSTVFHNRFGDITFRDFTSQGLTLESNDGDIEIQGMLLGKSMVHSSFGDITLKLSNKESELSYNINNDFGDIYVNDNEYEKKATNTTSTEHKLEIDSNDGDVQVTF